MGGYFKIWRLVFDHPVFKEESAETFKVFVWCIGKAVWDHNPNGSRKRGQFTTTRTRGSEELNVSGSCFYENLQKLQALGCISLESNSRGTTVTVCNYETYQKKLDENTEKATAGQQPGNSRATTYPLSKEGEEEKEEGRVKKIFDPLAPQFPTQLDSPAFSRVWKELISHRRSCRWSVREDWCVKQIEHLANFDESVATKAIEESIRNDWRGIFPEKYAPKSKTGYGSDAEEEAKILARIKAKE